MCVIDCAQQHRHALHILKVMVEYAQQLFVIFCFEELLPEGRNFRTGNIVFPPNAQYAFLQIGE